MSNVTIDIMMIERSTKKVEYREPFTTYLSSGMNGHNGALQRAYLEYPPELRNTDKHEYVYFIGLITPYCNEAQT